jgi:predicted RNA-binding Zn-ribbon protein involved in translation (DUF1610 family)
MTFLEYVCEAVLGPPIQSYGDGKSRWECPRCGEPTFSTRQHKRGQRDLYSCFTCRLWGDERDILDWISPVPSAEKKWELLRDMRREFYGTTTTKIVKSLTRPPGRYPKPSRPAKSDRPGGRSQQ